jgi:hypothetical protein
MRDPLKNGFFFYKVKMYQNRMTNYATSVRVLLYINFNEVDWDQLTPRELEAILHEVQKIWPPDMRSRVWFAVEKQGRFVGGRWETVVRVVCYHMPDKSQRAEIPQDYLRELLGKKFRIFPIVEPDEDDTTRRSARFRRLEMQMVEVLFMLE